MASTLSGLTCVVLCVVLQTHTLQLSQRHNMSYTTHAQPLVHEDANGHTCMVDGCSITAKTIEVMII